MGRPLSIIVRIFVGSLVFWREIWQQELDTVDTMTRNECLYMISAQTTKHNLDCTAQLIKYNFLGKWHKLWKQCKYRMGMDQPWSLVTAESTAAQWSLSYIDIFQQDEDCADRCHQRIIFWGSCQQSYRTPCRSGKYRQRYIKKIYHLAFLQAFSQNQY